MLERMRLILLFALITSICFAQQISPEILARTEPDFPEEARKAGVDGTVVVELVVDSDGNPTNLRIKKPIGFGFDEAALKAVASWKFKPVTKDGVTVPVETTVEVNFRNLDQNEPMHIRELSCRSRVLKAEHPASPAARESFYGTVSMDIDSQGVPENLHLVRLSDPSRETDVLQALREWRFEPSAAGVVTPCSLSFAMGRAPETNAYKIGNGVSRPSLITRVEPKYSEEARRAGLEGTVVLLVVVDATGRARDLRVIRPVGLGLDEEALDCVRRWVFQPGLMDGKAVAVQATIEVNFRMLGKNKMAWHLDRISFAPPALAERPHLTAIKFPKGHEGEHAFVVVSFDVDQTGKPSNVRADQSSDQQWESKVIDAVKGWRFEAGSKDGAAVMVPCTARIAIGR